MSVRELLEDTRRVLLAQAELGLQGAPTPEAFLEAPAPKPTPAVPSRPWHTKAKAKAPVVRSQSAADANVDLSAIAETGEPALRAIREALGECTRCPLHRGRSTLVFGVGDPNARLMFIGEAPGRDEDLQGEPFVGRAGQLLTRMIAAMGLRRSDVYIANIVKCRPPRNRDPEPAEVSTCEPYLKAQIRAIQPEVIVTLGKYSAQTLLQVDTPITRMRGQWREYEGCALMPTFHPAYLLRNPAEKRPVWQDLQDVMKRLDLPIPKKP